MFGNHLINTRTTMEIMRYQNKFCFKQRSVAEHMWSVAKIAEGLALWEMSKFGNQVNMGLLLEKAINHDLIESETGDILGPAKHKTKSMKAAIHELEDAMYKELIEPELPHSWRTMFKEFILNPKTDDIEGHLLRAADIIDTIIEAVEEIKLGNKSFECVLKENATGLLEIRLKSVDYFIRYAVNDLGLPVKEYYGDTFYNYYQTLEFDESVFNTPDIKINKQ